MLRKILLSAVILLIFTNVKASAGALINADVERVIEGLRRVCNNTNISLWGKEYYTYEGARRCELHWGNSQNNLIRFRLGNNNNVQRALVSVSDVVDYDSLKSSMESGLMYSAILIMAGLTQNELDNFSRRCFNDLMVDPYATYFHRTYTLWSSQTQRNIIVDVEYKNSRADYFIYAN